MHTPTLVVVAFGNNVFGCNGALNRSLSFALPSHSDNRASHVLLPILTLCGWCFALDVFDLDCVLQFMDSCWAGFISGHLQGAEELCLLDRLKKKRSNDDKSRFSQQ